ncbi:MAG: choline-sulfatase, partial [Rhodospirillales bacterium]|nr:choline-sulfatase [Rhodospirillales bacterium]
MSAGGGHDEVIGEYFAEGGDMPVFMIRRGQKKIIASNGRPAQYYDLANDPNEVNNLASDAKHADDVSKLLSEIDESYDAAALKGTVLESQRRRKFLKSVMRDQGVGWDYQPVEDAKNAYIRNTMPIYQLEKRSRFPQV